MSTKLRELNAWVEKLRCNETEWHCLSLRHGMMLCFTLYHDWSSLVCRLSCDGWKVCAVYWGVESEHYVDWTWYERYFEIVSCVSLSLIIIFGYWFTIFIFKLFYLANQLGNDAAKYIADVLKVNTTLESLDIGS